MVSPQTLAEMIRLGSKETEQCTGLLLADNRGGALNLSPNVCEGSLKFNERQLMKAKYTCALGAAVLVSTNPLTFLEEVPEELREAIIFNNDVNRWSREKIADWLETL